MKASDKAIACIKHYESLRLRSYICPAGHATIGYGSTRGVKLGQVMTSAQAEERLREDLRHFEKAVWFMVIKQDLKQHEFDALVSFAFNLGEYALEDSTLLKKVNVGDQYASAEFLRWNKMRSAVTGQLKPAEGLTRRRMTEKTLFDTGTLRFHF